MKSGSQTESQQSQSPGDTKPQSACISALRCLTERHQATSRAGLMVPSKQLVASRFLVEETVKRLHGGDRTSVRLFCRNRVLSGVACLSGVRAGPLDDGRPGQP